MTPMTRPPIVIEIEALDLEAVPPPRRAAVADAFVRELTALVQQGGASSLPPAPRIDPNAPPHRVGAALAHGVYLQLPPSVRGGS